MINLLTSLKKSLNLKNIKAALALITFVSLTSLCCGKRTAPLPPSEKVSQRATISGVQQGNQVLISWKMPARNTSENNALYIDKIDVYRLAEPLNSSQQITEEEFSSRSTIIKTISVSETDFALKTLTFNDELTFSDQAVRLRYAIRYVNNSGQKAAFSNVLTVEPSAKIAGRPENIESEISQESILLKWSKPQTNVDGSTPANILGYNIYRKTENLSDLKKLNSAPITDTEYADNFFEFEKKYLYTVRSVSIGSNAEPVESVSSEELEITAKDTFPPSSPESITIAASPNSISLFFAANSEKDIAGYKIYRSTDRSLPLDQWELITTETLKTNTFQDQKIESGTRYFYYITAIDNFGNTSQPSEIASEIVP